MTETILAIDDDADVRDLVSLALTESGYRVVTASDGPAGIAAYHAHQPDLIVLDIGLGSMDGLEVCRQLRAVGSTPIVFVTSRADEVDQLIGFAAGADDYLAKPFSPKLLVARVSTVLRRSQGTEQARTRFEAGPITADTETRIASVGTTDLDLTRTEFDLLVMLMDNPRRVVNREALLEGRLGILVRRRPRRRGPHVPAAVEDQGGRRASHRCRRTRSGLQAGSRTRARSLTWCSVVTRRAVTMLTP